MVAVEKKTPAKKNRLQKVVGKHANLDAEKGTRRRKKPRASYAVYVYKVLKQIHPECGISQRGMNIMNSFLNDIFDRIATEATRLLRNVNKRTLSSREVETAVRLMLPGELSKHAASEGSKAVMKYCQQMKM